MVVSFVDIGRIVGHHYLNILFIIKNLLNILIDCVFAIGDPTYLDPEHDYIEVTRRQTSCLDPVGNVGYDDENDIVTEDEKHISGCQAPISFTDVPIRYTESVVL